MKRREFLAHALTGAAVIGVAPTLLMACDGDPDTDLDTDTLDDDTSDDDTGAEDCLDCADSVAEGPSDSHGHFICLTQAEVDGGADLTYTSEGGSHDHTFTITAAQLADIAAGNEVTIESNDTHPHTWVVSMC